MLDSPACSGGAERLACPLSSVAIRPVEHGAFPQLSRTSCKEDACSKPSLATGVVIVGSGLGSSRRPSRRMRSPVLISLVPVPVPTTAAPSWRLLSTADMPRPASCKRGSRLAGGELPLLRVWKRNPLHLRFTRFTGDDALEPARQVPVALAEQRHRGRQEHAADDRRVEQDRHRESDAELLDRVWSASRRSRRPRPSRSRRS